MSTTGTASVVEYVIGLILLVLLLWGAWLLLDKAASHLWHRARRRQFPYFLAAVAVGIVAATVGALADIVHQNHAGLAAQLLIPNDQRIEVVSLLCLWLSAGVGAVLVLVLLALGITHSRATEIEPR